MTIEVYTREERKLRKTLGQLICNVRAYEAQIDALFHPSNPIQGEARGKKVAELLNKLTLANDQALYFGLGFDFHKDGQQKRKNGTNIKAIQKWAAKTTREK